MRVVVTESYQGEIESLPAQALAQRMADAFHEGRRLVMLEKGGRHTGDVEALDELTALLTRTWQARAEAMHASILHAVEHGHRER